MAEPEKRKHSNRIGISRWWWIIYAISIFLMIAPILWGFDKQFHIIVLFSTLGLCAWNAVMIFVVEILLMRRSSKNIQREFQDTIWDLHNLTEVDTWQLILSKWRDSLRSSCREIIFLYFLRVSTFFWWMVYIHLGQDGFSIFLFEGGENLIANLSDIRVDLQILSFGAIIMAIFLILEIMLVTALPLAESLFQKTPTSPTLIALGLRVGLPIVLGVAIYSIFLELPYTIGLVERWETYYSSEFHVAVASISLALADNGFGLIALRTNAPSFRELGIYSPDWNTFALMQFVGILLYLLWTWVMLRLAKSALDRQLRKGKRKQKPKLPEPV